MTLKYTEKISFADARKRLQPSFDPSKDSYATVTQTPPQSSRPLAPWARKIRLPIDFRTEFEYLKYILNYCLTRLNKSDESTPANPAARDAPSSDETPTPPQTTPEQKNETTIPNTESALQPAASNDIINDKNEIEMLTMSNKRTFNADSSEEDTINPLPAKKAATSSPASEQSGTRVPKGRGGGDLPKISAFPAKTPKSGGRGSSQGDKSPARAPCFSTNTGEGSASSAQGGFTFSKNKTVAIHFFLSGQKCLATVLFFPVLKLDNDPIQFVKEAKFLGLIWDTKFTFEPHIKYLKARCQKSLNILKVLSRTEWGADRTTLLKLYRSLVRSKLDYGYIVYGSAS